MGLSSFVNIKERVTLLGIRDPSKFTESKTTKKGISFTTDSGSTEMSVDSFLALQKAGRADLLVSISNQIGKHSSRKKKVAAKQTRELLLKMLEKEPSMEKSVVASIQCFASNLEEETKSAASCKSVFGYNLEGLGTGEFLEEKISLTEKVLVFKLLSFSPKFDLFWTVENPAGR